MSAVACPKCSARLKVSKQPARDSKVLCPQCGHSFVLAGRTREVPVEATEGLGDHTMLMVGLVIALALIGGALVGGVFLFRVAEPPAASAPVVTAPPLPAESEPVPAKPEPAPPGNNEPGNNDKERWQHFTNWMIKGGVADAGKKFDEAVAAYREALKIFPNDAKAKQKLDDARTALAVQAKVKQEDAKTREELAKLLKQADVALEMKQYAAASEIYKLALQKAPGDASAAKGLILAQQALAKDQAEQKKLTEFQSRLAAGKSALKAGQAADARREFMAALQILPGNAEATAFLRQAELLINAAQDDADRKKEYVRLMDLAGAALRNQRFDDALQGFQQVLKLFPKDAVALKGWNDAQAGAKLAQTEFNGYMAKGAQAMRDMRYQDAVFAFKEATRLFPGNTNATKALREAETAYDSAINYSQSMKLATAAMLTMRYQDAVLQYQEALKAMPGDMLATQGLVDARRLLDDDLRKKADFDKNVQAGLLLVKQQNYAEANKYFNQAAKLVPMHPQILLVQQQVRYTDAMAKGTAALNSGKAKEAIPYFQAALTELPNDFAARAALTRAMVLAKMK